MTSKGITLKWDQKTAINIILCNKDWLHIDQNQTFSTILNTFLSNPNSLLIPQGPQIIKILETISKTYNLPYFETAQHGSITLRVLQKKDEEKHFFEQIKDKEAPLILLKRLSQDKPYAYFENDNGIIYLLTALFTQNAQKWSYCNFDNQWRNLSENPKDKSIKFSEDTIYVYTKINKENLDKEKVKKILPAEFGGCKNELGKVIMCVDSNNSQEKEFESLRNENEKLKKEIEKLNAELIAERTKNNEVNKELQKEIIIKEELQKNSQNDEDIMKDYEDAKNENIFFKIKVNELSDELNKKEDEKKSIEAIIDILQKENEKYENNLQALIQENQAIKEEKQNLQSQQKSLTAEIKRLRTLSLPPQVISYPLIFNMKKLGIPNIGNTCYLNSLLQVFASNNEFCEKIKPLEYGLFSTLSSLLLSIKSPESNISRKLVNTFKLQLDTEFPWLGNYTQQDSKEVMIMLLGKLSDLTYIDPLFTITYKKSINCQVCKYRAKLTEPNLFITVPSNKFSSIQDFLQELKQPKNFTGENKLFCEKCNKLQDCTEEFEEIEWPSTVTFYLPSNNSTIKINEELEIEGTYYRWYGLICHYGTSRSGHYIAYTWNTRDWTEYNDSNARDVRPSSMDVENGYLAFYARAGDLK